MNKEKSLSELSESLYEAFPTLPRAHLDAVSRRTWDYLESRWHKRKTADGPSDPFLVFYGDATNSLSDLATIAKNLGQEFACRSGCSHCCKSEAINAWLISSMLTTIALEAVNALPSVLGLTIVVSVGYCAAHYWARRSHGRTISRMGASHPR